MNTDYLSISQIGKYTYTCVIGGGTFPSSGEIDQQIDFSIATQNGPIDQIMTSLDGETFAVGNWRYIDYTSLEVGGLINIYRTSPNNLRIYVELYGTPGTSAGTKTLTIKMMSFRPPNVF